MRKNILILGHNDATQFIDIFNQYTALFDKNKYAVTVAYLTGEPNEQTRMRTIAEEVLFLNIPKRAIRTLKIPAITKLAALCRQKKFDIVICHRYKPTYIMMWVAQFISIPALVCVMHELKTMSHWGRQCLIAFLKRKNMLFAGVSNAVRDDMQKYLWAVPKEQVVTLYNAIDIDLIEPQLFEREEARKTLKLSSDDFIFGNLGRLVPNKDQATLIQAFAKIKPTCPHAKLVIAGDGPLLPDLKAQVKQLQLEEEVIFTGFVNMGFRYMKAFDCFTLSSTQEAFGRVLLEAMIAKCPIIATRTHGIPEVVGNAGTLVNPRDIDALAQAMKEQYAHSNSVRTELGDIAYQQANDHFSMPTFQKQFWNHPILQRIKASLTT